MLKGINRRLEARRHDGVLDSGDVVQVTLLIAGFVIIAIVLLVWLGSAALNKGADTSNCIEAGSGSNTTYNQHSSERSVVCGSDTVGHSKENTIGFNGVGKGSSFKKDQSYINRY